MGKVSSNKGKDLYRKLRARKRKGTNAATKKDLDKLREKFKCL